MAATQRALVALCPGWPVTATGRWELAVAAVERFALGVEVLAPGSLALAAKGPARFFGGEAAVASKVATAVEAALGEPGVCRVGVADGLFAAGIAACLARPGEPLVVEEGTAGEFLAPLPLAWLASPLVGAFGTALGSFATDLVELLERLGIRALGEFAALPSASVLGRFGNEGAAAQRLARGLPERPVQGRHPPVDWAVVAELSPPADQLQAAVFVGRALAEQLQQRLSGQGLACTRLSIEVETEQGAKLRRSWRHEGTLAGGAVAERVRWQLEAWSQGGPSSGRVARLTLAPEEVYPESGRQLGFWGEDPGAAERAAKALARAQALLGPEGVMTSVLQGGRDYTEQVRLVPWGEPREQPSPNARGRRSRSAAQAPKAQEERPRGAPPWPGRLPGLAPAVVYRPPLVAEVLDAEGNTVVVGGRGHLSAPPATVVVPSVGYPLAVTAWSGPWPLEEHWWRGGGRRRAWLQVVLAGRSLVPRGQEDRAPGHAKAAAYLLAREKGRWWVEACYD